MSQQPHNQQLPSSNSTSSTNLHTLLSQQSLQRQLEASPPKFPAVPTASTPADWRDNNGQAGARPRQQNWCGSRQRDDHWRPAIDTTGGGEGVSWLQRRQFDDSTEEDERHNEMGTSLNGSGFGGENDGTSASPEGKGIGRQFAWQKSNSNR